MNELLSEMSEYFSDPEADSFSISREEWQALMAELSKQQRTPCPTCGDPLAISGHCSNHGYFLLPS